MFKNNNNNTNEINEFLNVFPILKNDILEFLNEKKLNIEYINWIDQLIEVNTLGGKYFRGLTVLDTVNDIKGGVLDDETILLCKVAGWCIELLQASILIADDIMDGGTMRRNHLCWYRYPNPINKQSPVDNIAINDSFILESFVYLILKKYFKSKPYYIDIVELFHEVSLNTYLGQLLDTSPRILDRGDFKNFTFDRYYQTVQFKTSYYTLYIPVALGMIICGMDISNSKYNNMKTILMSIGEFMNVQDDYFDVYGEFELMGKIGTDIQENKITWLLCQAISKSNNNQYELLKNHYGINNPSDISIVKQVYEDLNLKNIYRQYEDNQYLNIMNKIQNETNIPQSIFKRLLNRYYKRNR